MTPLTFSPCLPKSVKDRSYLIAFLFALGLFHSVGFATPPQLVGEARWMTDGQERTHLDLYPLSGRGDSSKIFVQADLMGSGPITEDQVQLYLENPILLPDSFEATDSVEVIKGNGGEATVFGVLDVDNNINWALYTPETTLKLKMRTVDESGTVAVFDLGDVFLYGPNPGGLLSDVTPPMVVSSLINNGDPIVLPENMVEDEFEYSGFLEAIDVEKGFENASLVYRHESGAYLFLELDSANLSSGTLKNGVYTSTSSLSKYAPSGTYNFYFFTIEDKAGNSFFRFSSGVPEGVQASVEVVNPNEDLLPPELTSPVLITPISGDVTTDPLLLTFNLSLKDEGSGFNFGTITVFHSTDPDVTSQTGYITDSELVGEGDEFAGSYEVQVLIPQGKTPGDYFYQIRLYDVSGRSALYGKVRPESTIQPLPLPVGSTEMVTITNTGSSNLDTTPPVLDSIAVVFNQDLAEGPGVMEVTMMISEPESTLAFSGNKIRLISPTGGTDINQSFGIFNLDAESGAYKVQIPLSKAIEPGTYCMAVHLRNSDGFEVDYGQNYDYLPFPNDFPGTWDIVNTGPVDYTPPIPVEFTVTPGFVTVGMDVTLSVSLHIIDEGTGLQFVSGFQTTTLDLMNGLPGEFGFRQSIFSTQLEDPLTDERGEGTIFNVTYTFDIPLTGDQFSGDFLSFRLKLMDCAGNTRIYDSSICNFNGNASLPYNIVQIGTNGNVDPVITSDGGGNTASINAAENQTAVTQVTATDTPAEILAFSISGGADLALFDLDANSGVLTFKAAPSFASPTDSGANGVYEVTVQVSDPHGGTDSQDISVTVIQVGEPPVITSNGGGPTAAINAEENQTAVTTVTATDGDGDTPEFSISAGADKALFIVDSGSGFLTFNTPPNFEIPGDAGVDGVYEVTVQASDGKGGIDTQAISVTVTNVNEAPVISSNGGGETAAFLVEENLTNATTLTATDSDLPADTLIFTIMGGADADRFNLDSNSGALTFKTAPSFAAPTDSDTNNVYEVTVEVSDGGVPLGKDSQGISVSIVMHIVNETDYEAYAALSGTFPQDATPQQKAFDFDYDGDGKTNGEEYAAGTNPNDPNDFFASMVHFEPGVGTTILFGPYYPDLNEYTLFSAFQGVGRKKSVALSVTAQPVENDPNVGFFTLPPSQQGLEFLHLFVKTVKTSL